MFIIIKPIRYLNHYSVLFFPSQLSHTACSLKQVLNNFFIEIEIYLYL